MKTLPRSCSNAFINRNFAGNPFGFRDFCLNKPRICFFPLEKIIKARYLCLISVQQKASVAVRCASLVPDSQVELDTAESQIPNAYQLKTVRVKFLLQKECSFGERFFVVGDDPIIGLWDPNSAVPLNWSDGHVWSVELDIPVGKSINFKFVLKRISSGLLWQPGPDRTFQTWETENTITVLEDWESAGYQKVMEETALPEQDEELKDDQEMEVLAEKFTPTTANIETAYGMNQGADTDHSLHQEKMPVQAKSYSVGPNENSPSPENTKPIIADNIIFASEDSLTDQNYVLGEQRTRGTNDQSVDMSNRSMLIADNILESDGRALTMADHTTQEADSVLIMREEDPVLVPGLDSSTTPQEDNKTTTINGPSRVSEAKTQNLPELDEKHELVVYPVQAKLAEMSNSNSKQLVGKVDHMSHQATEEKQDLEPLESRLCPDEKREASDDPFHGKTAETSSSESNRLVDSQVHSKPLEAIEDLKDSEPFQSNPLQNDIQWGRRTLQKLLNNLGIL